MSDDHNNAPASSLQALPKRLDHRYLLAVPIPFACDPQGRVWLDKLWWHDLRAHLDYLENITVVAPIRKVVERDPDMVEAVASEGTRLNFVGLFPDAGMTKTLLHLPFAFWRAWKLVGQSDLVHSGVAGWPIPIGAIINPVAFLRRKPVIMVIESAFWRMQPGYRRSWKMHVHAWLNEHFARWSLRRAALGIYTHEGYKDSLPVGSKGTSVVLPASWISDRDIISPHEARMAWDEKSSPPRFLLASRLDPQKGISLFLEVLHQLEQDGAPIEIDVIGSGPMRSDIEAFINKARVVRVRLLDPVPYGDPFMRLLRKYHAVVVPLTGDEQARILYDSFSQAVPVVATNTAGNGSVVTDGATGFLIEANARSFAHTLASCSRDPEGLRRMGLSALNVAAGYTHASMHRKRAELLAALFKNKP